MIFSDTTFFSIFFFEKIFSSREEIEFSISLCSSWTCKQTISLINLPFTFNGIIQHSNIFLNWFYSVCWLHKLCKNVPVSIAMTRTVHHLLLYQWSQYSYWVNKINIAWLSSEVSERNPPDLEIFSKFQFKFTHEALTRM